MKRLANSLWTSSTGSSAAEFALVLPLLLIFLFGIIDGGRFMWAYNRAEKATQTGTRFAVVTDPVAPGLYAYKFTSSGLGAGDTIPASSLGTITCSSTTCTCTATPCPSGTGAPTGAWTQLVARMKQIDPDIAETNVQVVYQGSGLGFAGNPSGMDVDPIVSVRLTGLQFKPLTTLTLATFRMPDFHAALTAEDSYGTQSN
ncbi:TadE family protein [Sphingomonas sp.]|uniref:TadE family protein n=1 Tax=Sphingomonas sp. TaxID=28214 RepID=UPI0025EE2F43|nr:TadE family protein [Sphingomonas sp.]MBV9527439.1 pilus assembly protein [Sphingomonas sp.]